MKGIEPRGKCPTKGCNRTFVRYQDKAKTKMWPDGKFRCPDHMTEPKRFVLKFKYKGQWVTRAVDFTGKTLRTYEDAYDLRKLSLREIEDNPHSFNITKWNNTKHKAYLFDDLIDEWFNLKKVKMERGELSTSYIEKLDSTINKHFKYFHGKDVRDIKELKTFDAGLSLGASTRVVVCSIATDFFAWVKEDKELITKLPKVPDIKVSVKPLEPVSREVQEKFLKEVVPDYLKPIFAWMIYQGCRPAEACALKWESLAKDKVKYVRTFSGVGKKYRMLKENTKTNDGGRENYIWPETIPYLPRKTFPLSFVFTNKNGQNFFPKNLSQQFIRFRDKFNKKFNTSLKASLYVFTKHSFGCYMLNKYPEQQYALQKHFGHTNPRTMEKYAKLQTADVWKHIDNVSRLDSTKVPPVSSPAQ